MKTALCLALVGAMMAGPAMARGMQQQSSQDQPYGVQQQQKQSSTDQETIREVQQKLSQQGYNVNPDGIMGPNTRKALSQFQNDQGIQANGQLNQQTLAALGVEGATQQAQTPEQDRMMQPSQPQMQQPGQGGMQDQPVESPPNGMSR